jgi:hypothetical protein
MLLAGAAVPASETGRAGVLFDLINRMDGVKMLALAAMALAAVGLVRPLVLLPRRLGYTAAVLAAALTASGVGYLLPNDTLAQAAGALPLLLGGRDGPSPPPPQPVGRTVREPSAHAVRCS